MCARGRFRVLIYCVPIITTRIVRICAHIGRDAMRILKTTLLASLTQTNKMKTEYARRTIIFGRLARLGLK